MGPILFLLGTRPEAVKLAPLAIELRRRGSYPVELGGTGQHREMLQETLAAFSLSLDHDLDLLREGEGIVSLLGRMLRAVDRLLEARSPVAVVVQGDTLSALAGALAAFYRGIPVCHVEAGLRTGQMRSPFPEEMHRRTIAGIAELHFAPTVEARKRLLLEGCCEKNVFISGNTGIDALRLTLAKPIPEQAEQLLAGGRRILLFTAHRREHWGKTLDGMYRALRRILEAHPDLTALCPLHPNPRVRQSASVLAGNSRAVLLEPLTVDVFHHLLAKATLIMTDSGGIQEEAVALGIPTVVMRYSTERCEGLRAGVLRLSGSGEEGIVALANRLLSPGSELYESMRHRSAVFGDGRASARIADAIEQRIAT